MTRPVELTGTNLWTVQSFKRGKTQAGDLKVIVKYKCGEYDLEDSILLQGKPTSIKIGREHLAALGVPADFNGSIEDLPIQGKRVWICTHIEEREMLATSGPSVGKMVTYKNLRVDINVLSHRGYQPEANVPAGCTAPAAAGNGPAVDDDTPF